MTLKKKKGCWIAAGVFFIILGGVVLVIADRVLNPILHNVLNPPRQTTEDFVRRGVKVRPEQLSGHGEEVYTEGSDGKQLRGWYLPSIRQPNTSPLVILLHGMGDGCETLLEGGVAFQREGINSLCIDHRGFGKSEGSLSFGVQEREDIRNWIEWARNKKGFGGNIGIYGGSYGAGIGLQALAVNPKVDCMVAFHPFTDLRDLIRHHFKEYTGFSWLPVISQFAERKLYGAIGAEGRDDVSAISLLENRDQVPPIFLVHGTADTIIPVEHSRRLKNHFPGQVEYIEVEGAGHDDLLSKGPPDLFVRTRRFFARNLLRD